MNATMYQLLDQKEKEIATVLRKKYPDIIQTFPPYITDRTRFDETGMKELHLYYTSETKYKVINKESSHPELSRPCVTFTITIKIEEGRLDVHVNVHADSVDVNYCQYEKKVNNRNIAIARKQRRQVDNYLHGAFKNKVVHSYELTQSENEAFRQSLRQLIEEQKLRSLIHNKLTRSVKNIPKGIQCPLTHIRREANSYYLGSEKIGTKDNISSYIKNNIRKFIHDFDTQYPELAKLEAEKTSV